MMWAESAQNAQRLVEKYRPDAMAALDKLASYGLDCENRFAVSQRFDIVPLDFEASLYVDFADFLRGGGTVQPCSYCKLAMPVNARQQARARKRLPVYHPGCHEKQRAASKAAAYQSRSKDPQFREKENTRVRTYRAEAKSARLKRRAK
jgi:hypothetical protein